MTDGLDCLVSCWIISNVSILITKKKCDSLGFPIFCLWKKGIVLNNLLAKITLIDNSSKNSISPNKNKNKCLRCHRCANRYSQLVTKGSFRKLLNEFVVIDGIGIPECSKGKKIGNSLRTLEVCICGIFSN